MKLVLFCFLLAASHSFIFCQDANKAEALFARIEALDATGISVPFLFLLKCQCLFELLCFFLISRTVDYGI